MGVCYITTPIKEKVVSKTYPFMTLVKEKKKFGNWGLKGFGGKSRIIISLLKKKKRRKEKKRRGETKKTQPQPRRGVRKKQKEK